MDKPEHPRGTEFDAFEVRARAASHLDLRPSSEGLFSASERSAE
jgi:hypothetical protein